MDSDVRNNKATYMNIKPSIDIIDLIRALLPILYVPGKQPARVIAINRI